jgi:hypothetical protein
MGLFFPGTPRIALLSGGVKILTLYLPPPDKGKGLGLEFIEKGFYPELIDGSESCRRLGWIPELKLQWTAYNDLIPIQGWTIGAANGNQASVSALLAMLDNTPGTVEISPGPSAGGFIINKTTIPSFGIAGAQGIVTGLQITLRGGAILTSKALGAW